MNNEKWNEICFLLTKYNNNSISESDFEQNVIQALRVLDWKEFLGDIQIRPSFQIGASNRIMPDFVINSSDKKNLFVIEIKQPSIQLSTSFQRQLFSYMRQLRLQYGVLIGEVIQVFYDGDLTDHEDPVLLETIRFEKDNPKGEKFVGLFCKEKFSYDLLEQFTLNSLRKINRAKNQKILLQKILSKDYELIALELIKQNFLNQYDAELIDQTLKDISINFSRISTPSIEQSLPNYIPITTEENKNSRDKTKYIINGMGRPLPKNRFVLELVRAYIKDTPTDFETLKKIFLDEYQGSAGVINSLASVQTKYANKSNKRHFIGPDEILLSADNIEFVVSTQWKKDTVCNIVDLARNKGFDVQEV